MKVTDEHYDLIKICCYKCIHVAALREQVQKHGLDKVVTSMYSRIYSKTISDDDDLFFAFQAYQDSHIKTAVKKVFKELISL